MTPEHWDNRFNTNLRHYFFAIQAIAPGMIARGGGSIVNIGSSCYHMQEDFFPGYAIAKSGVEGLTRTMARTFGPHNIRMNCVLPGWVGDRTAAGEMVDARRRGRHAARPGAEAAHLRRRVRADGAVPGRRRRRRVYRAELPGRRRKVLTGRSGKLCGSRSRPRLPRGAPSVAWLRAAAHRLPATALRARSPRATSFLVDGGAILTQPPRAQG